MTSGRDLTETATQSQAAIHKDERVQSPGGQGGGKARIQFTIPEGIRPRCCRKMSTSPAACATPTAGRFCRNPWEAKMAKPSFRYSGTQVLRYSGTQVLSALFTTVTEYKTQLVSFLAGVQQVEALLPCSSRKTLAFDP